MQKQLSVAELPASEGLCEVLWSTDRVSIRVTSPAGHSCMSQLPVPGSPSHPSPPDKLSSFQHCHIFHVWPAQSCYQVSRGAQTPGKHVPAPSAPSLVLLWPPGSRAGLSDPCRIHPVPAAVPACFSSCHRNRRRALKHRSGVRV